MYLLPADPQMVRAMDQLITGNPHVFIYDHNNTKNRLLLNVVSEVLERGKSILIIVPDQTDSDSFHSYISKSILADYCLYIQDNQNVDPERIKQILHVEDQAVDVNFENCDLLKSRMHGKLQTMNQAYEAINTQVLQGRSWKDLLQYVDNTEPPDAFQSFVNKIEENKLDVTYNTYGEARMFLEEVDSFYQSDYKYLEENDILNYNKDFNYTEWKNNLTSYSEVMRECIFDLNLFVDNYSRENQNQALKDIQRYESLIEKIQEDISEYKLNYSELVAGNERSLSSVVRKKFNSDYKSKLHQSNEIRMIIDLLLEDLNSSAFFTFQMAALSRDQSTLADYELWLSRVKRHFTNWKSDLKEYNSNHIKQLNCQNTELNDLKHIDRRIKNVLKQINTNAYLTKKYEDNTFSVLKKIEFVRQLNYDISKSLWRLEDHKEYVTFRVKVAKQPKQTQALLDLVIEYDREEWINLLDYYFLHKAVYNNAESSMPYNDAAKEGYINSLKMYREGKINKIKDYSAYRRKLAIENLKTSDSDLYKMLSKPNEQIYNNWLDILLNHHSKLMDLFPIMIIKEGVLKNQTFPSHLKWHQTWIDNMTQFQRIDLDMISKISEWQCFTSRYNINKNETERLAYLSQERLSIKTHKLNTVYSNNEPLFKNLKHSQKLNIAKQLDSQLDFAAHKLRIFQLKDITILSYFGDFLNNQLLGFLENKGVKEIKPNKNVDYGLTDVLVSAEHNIVVCQEDGLFDLEQLEHAEWQHTTMQRLSRMGFHQINIWSAEIFMKNPYHVRRTFYKVFDKIYQPITTLATEHDKS